MENEIKEAAVKYNYISQEDYLAMEREATEKHEYYQGDIFAMSGASFNHTRILMNLTLDIGNKLNGKKCEPFGNDLRIHIPKNSLFTYPDLTIICDKPDMMDNKFDTVINPSVIFELLSKSTRNYDMGQKFTLCADILTLQEYILIDTEKIYVEKRIRHADNSWQLYPYSSLEDSFIIETIATRIDLKDIYKNISFTDHSLK